MYFINGYFFIDDSFIFGSVEVKDGFFGDFHEGEAKEELLQDAYTDLYEDMKNAVRFGIPKHEAILAATRVPADYIGETKIGRIEKGAYADFVVCDETLERRAVYISGNHPQSISG